MNSEAQQKIVARLREYCAAKGSPQNHAHRLGSAAATADRPHRTRKRKDKTMKGILIDHDTGDLLVKNGSLVPGDTDGQIAESVLNSMRGEWKEFPLIGGEVRKMLGGTLDLMWRPRDFYTRHILPAMLRTFSRVLNDLDLGNRAFTPKSRSLRTLEKV